MSTIFVTGGAGYIGSHTCVELLQAGHDVVVFDNFCNSHPEALRRVESITGRQLTVVRGDIRDQAAMEAALREHACHAVIHFAGLKAVGESTQQPVAYYDNNFVGTVRLLQAMSATGVKTLVFSSSATVYGEPQALPLTETHPLSATNPYGRSKLMIEDMLRDLFAAEPDWRIGLLRYFNPVGAHTSGLIGESPNGIPNNLLPYICQVAVGKRESLSVFGGDYPTPDGTGVRDYIHVADLADGHVKAVEAHQDDAGLHVYNLGTGQGSSVLEMVHAFEQAADKKIAYAIAPRRPGDIATCYADASLAKTKLNWTATRDLQQMMQDSWRWQSRNPNGYDD